MVACYVFLILFIILLQVATFATVATSPGKKRRSYRYHNPPISGLPNALKYVTGQGGTCLLRKSELCDQRSNWQPLSTLDAEELLRILGFACTALINK